MLKLGSRMEDSLINIISNSDGLYVYAGIVFLLFLGAIGFPIPEDIPIILAGVLSAKKMANVQTMFFACYISVVCADLLIFTFGYFFGQKLLQAGAKSPFLPAITEERIEDIREGLRKRRLMYIFVARHLFAVRTLTFLTAGALRIPTSEFLIADATAALVSVSIMLGLGYFLGETLSLEVLNHIIGEASLYLLACVLVFGLIYYRRKKRRATNSLEQNTPDSPSSPRAEQTALGQ